MSALIKLNHMQKKLMSLVKARQNANEHVEEMGHKISATAEIAGTALVLGMVQGASKEPVAVAGLPLEIVVGAPLSVAGILGFFGKGASRHVKNLGDGALAAYMSQLGFGLGRSWMGKSKKTGVKGIPDRGGGTADSAVADALRGED